MLHALMPYALCFNAFAFAFSADEAEFTWIFRQFFLGFRLFRGRVVNFWSEFGSMGRRDTFFSPIRGNMTQNVKNREKS